MIILISYNFKVTDFYVSTTYISVLLTLASENYLTHFYEWTIGNETPHYGRSLTPWEKKLILGYLQTSFLSRVFHQIVVFFQRNRRRSRIVLRGIDVNSELKKPHQRRRKRENTKKLKVKTLNVSHTFWQISLPSSRDSKVVKFDRNGYAIVASITKIVVSAITILATSISWEIPKESFKTEWHARCLPWTWVWWPGLDSWPVTDHSWKIGPKSLRKNGSPKYAGEEQAASELLKNWAPLEGL